MVERSLSTGGKMSAPYLRLMGSNSNKLHVQVMILNNFLFLFYKHPHTLFFLTSILYTVATPANSTSFNL